MARWSVIENNVVFVFRKSLETLTDEPYRGILENFVIRVNRGMDASEAICYDLERVPSPFMKNVFTNIASVIENNGDLKILLGKFEYEAFKIEGILWDNNINLYRDRVLMVVLEIMVIVTLIRMYRLSLNVLPISIASVITLLIAIIVSWRVARPKY
jgi:hypothetical protein